MSVSWPAYLKCEPLLLYLVCAYSTSTHQYGSEEPNWSVLLTQLKADADNIKPLLIHDCCLVLRHHQHSYHPSENVMMIRDF